MFLKVKNRNHRISLSINEKTKNREGLFKNHTIFNLGTFSDSLKLGSQTSLSLIRKTIDVVQHYCKSQILEKRLTDSQLVDFLNNQADPKNLKTKNAGTLLLDKVLEQFQLKKLFKKFQSQTRRGYDLYDYFKFIVFNNIIDPGSLLHYFNTKDDYDFLPEDENIKEQDLYDFLTFFYEKCQEVQKVLFTTTLKIIGVQRVHVYFYDGTNFTFCCTKADPDHLDRLDGVVKKGLRQFGYSKDKRFDRVSVALGIISEDLEIPLFFTVFPGSDQEISHIKEDIDKLTTSLINLDVRSRSIIAADAANYSGDIIFRLSGANNNPETGDGYIIGRSINQVDSETRQWILQEDDYYPISRRKRHRHKRQRKKESFTMVKHRTIRVNNPVKLENGKTIRTQVRQKQVAIFSMKRKFKALETIGQNVERALKTTGSSAALKKLVKRKSFKFTEVFGVFKAKGKEKQTKQFQAQVDMKEIQKEIKKAGFFLLTTNETGWPDGKILHCYREKNKIEHLIRTLKSVIKASPVYVYTYEHIVSHFQLSTISLIVLNFLRELIRRCTGHRLSPERIQKALQKFSITFLRNDVFIISPVSNDLKLLFQTLNIDLGDEQVAYRNLNKVF